MTRSQNQADGEAAASPAGSSAQLKPTEDEEEEKREEENEEESKAENAEEEGEQEGEEPQPMTLVEELKEILVNLTDDGIDRIRELLPQLTEAEVNFKDKNGNGWLHWLAVSKKLDSVDQNRVVSLVYSFSAAGVNYNLRNLTKNTALHFAVAGGAPLRVINALLKIGVDPGFTNSKGRTAKSCTRDRAILKTLEMFTPPLDEAIKDGDEQQVKDLLSYWVKVTNYHMDISKRHPEIRQLLEEWRPTCSLIHRCLAGDNQALQLALEEDPELQLNIADESYLDEEAKCQSLPLLYQLVWCPYACEAAVFMLEKLKPDVCFPVKYKGDGQTVPFWIAFRSSSHPEKDQLQPLIQSCVDYKASLDSLDHETMLTFYQEERETFDLLVERGFEFWKPDASLRNLADVALLQTLKAQEELDVKEALDKLEDLDAALLPVMLKWPKEKLAECMSAGYWPCVTFRTMRNLRKAKGKKEKKFVKCVEEMAQLWTTYRRLRHFIELGNTAGFRDAASDEACAVSDKKGQTLVHWAVVYERRFVLKHILDKHSVMVDKPDYNGRTALHYAQGIEEEFMYNNLVRAGADPDIQDSSASSEIRRSTGYAVPANADVVKSYYRQAIKNERKDTNGHSHFLLLLHLAICEAVDNNDEEALDELTASVWPDLSLEMLGRLNKMFPKQPHRLGNLIVRCIDKGREEFGRKLLKAGANVEFETRVSGATRHLDELVRTAGMDLLADDIENLRNSRQEKAAVERARDFSDEGETIVSVDTVNSGATPEEPVKKPKKKKNKSKKKKKNKNANKNKVEESEVCAIL